MVVLSHIIGANRDVRPDKNLVMETMTLEVLGWVFRNESGLKSAQTLADQGISVRLPKSEKSASNYITPYSFVPNAAPSQSNKVWKYLKLKSSRSLSQMGNGS